MTSAPSVGDRFGKLAVIARAKDAVFRTGKGRRWLCHCDCGTEKIVLDTNLRRGATNSCGCAQKDNTVTHGQSRTSYYQIWEGMIARCSRPTAPRYADYGGRGIRVCDRWRDFALFQQDMGSRPGLDYSVEREDNDGDYEPANCRWATRSEQQRHKRLQRNNTSGAIGVHPLPSGRWAARIKVNGKSRHLGVFDSVPEASAARKTVEKSLGFHPAHGEPR